LPMNPGLREQFDNAVAGDPGADTAAMARAAIVRGGGLRRRRRLLTGVAAVAAAIAVLAGTNTLFGRPAEPEVTLAAALAPVTAPSCTPVDRDATDAALFLGAATPAERAAVEAALRTDARVATFTFEGREQAYHRFTRLWRDSPDLVASVSPPQFPESFRLRLKAPADFRTLRQRYATMPGVTEIDGRRCAPGAPIGGVL
jgi:cell division transport system permease protein